MKHRKLIVLTVVLSVGIFALVCMFSVWTLDDIHTQITAYHDEWHMK